MRGRHRGRRLDFVWIAASQEFLPSLLEDSADSESESSSALSESPDVQPTPRPGPEPSTSEPQAGGQLEEDLAISDDFELDLEPDELDRGEGDSNVDIVQPPNPPPKSPKILSPKAKPPSATDQPWIRKRTNPTKVTGHRKSATSSCPTASVDQPSTSAGRSSTSSRPHSRLDRIRQLTPPLPPRRTVEQQQNAARRTKELGADRLIRYATGLLQNHQTDCRISSQSF